MNKKENALQRVLILLAMAAALVLMFALGGRYLRDGKTLGEKQQELAVSRATWEGIAEKKETLQEELKEVTNQLKEARLTLEESNTRAEELREQIETLKKEIEALKSAE